MIKRALILDHWDTARDGRLTLTSISFDPPTVTQVRQSVPGMSGDIDLSEVAAGVPTYGTRQLTATLETTFGRRADRIGMIDDLIARVHGKRVQLRHPDYPDGYYSGRVEIGGVVHHAAYSELSLTATCDPYRLAVERTTQTFAARSQSVGVAGISVELASASSTGAVYDTSGTDIRLEVTAGIGGSAVFCVDAYPDTDYYVAMQRTAGRGAWTLALENVQESFTESCYIRSDATGKFYIKARRYSTDTLLYSHLRVVPVSELVYARTGVAPAVADVRAEKTMLFSSGGDIMEIGTAWSQIVLAAGTPELLAITAEGGEVVELKYQRKAW